ncbi:hypothetical protein ABW21_db0206910 [Orbilia brochopaga]|nr:hypothetical protein ABW21_db0206910 [Drechslerella brochopaga]
MSAAWFNIQARDPYHGAPGPDGFSGIHSEAVDAALYNDHVEFFTEVHNSFVNGAITTLNGQKPKLYCSDEWAERQDPNVDPWYLPNGQIARRNDNSIILLRQLPQIQQRCYDNGVRNDWWPIWIPDERRYIMAIAPNPTFCHGGLAGSTIPQHARMTLCPRLFGAENESDLPEEGDVKPYQALQDFDLASSTLLHETLHLILRQRNQFPESCMCVLKADSPIPLVMGC